MTVSLSPPASPACPFLPSPIHLAGAAAADAAVVSLSSAYFATNSGPALQPPLRRRRGEAFFGVSAALAAE